MPKDFRGREIKVGDTIVYPGRQSSSLWMTEGEVTGVKSVWYPGDREETFTLRVRVVKSPFVKAGKQVSISSIDNVVVLEGSNDRT